MATESIAGGHRPPVSRFSIKRKSVQMILALTLILVVEALLVWHASRSDDGLLLALASSCLGVTLFAVFRFVHTGIRTVELEIWIRHMGEGNLDYTVELSGNDEVNEAAKALERLRQRSIEALQLDLVRELSESLQRKNDELERVLAELRQTQDRIILRRKLVELGELTAGVAHEIRNPLNFMKNFSEASEDLVAELRHEIDRRAGELSEDGRRVIVGATEELADNLRRIRSHGDRADRIVRDMVTMGRGGGERQSVDINDLLRDRATIAFHSASALDEEFEIDIRGSYAPDVGELEVVPDDMGRVFLNIVSNACSAMIDKRRLLDADDDSYQPTLWLSTEQTGDEIVIRIQDNGTGIPADSMDKIFNPFFTTKPSGTGTGLGLSISNDVVREHGGSMTAESEPGEFTEIVVRLPVTAGGEGSN
ncbi:MAG: ATP-binding protein [bacterium]|nr:ATP-binding protein [bacterium]